MNEAPTDSRGGFLCCWSIFAFADQMNGFPGFCATFIFSS